MGWTQLLLFLCSAKASFSFPQAPFYDFQDFPVPAVNPGVTHSAPRYKSYEPVYHKPEPVYHKPEPVYHKPEPVYHKPEPIYHQPRPVYHQPKQTYPEPAPLYISGPPYHNNPPSYVPTVPKVIAKHQPAYPKPDPLPSFVNLGPGPYQPSYTNTADSNDEPAPDTKTKEVDLAEDVTEAGGLAEEVEDIENTVASITESVKSTKESGKPEKLVIAPEATTTEFPTTTVITTENDPIITTTAPETATFTVKDLVDMAVERLNEMEENIKVMEEIEEDGLVVLEPLSSGEIISIDSDSNLDGMNIVEFEAELV